MGSSSSCLSTSDSDCSDEQRIRYLKAKYRGDNDPKYNHRFGGPARGGSVHQESLFRNDQQVSQHTGGTHWSLVEENIGESRGNGLWGTIALVGTGVAALWGGVWAWRKIRKYRAKDKAVREERMATRCRREARLEELTRDDDDYIVNLDPKAAAAQARRVRGTGATSAPMDRSEALRLARQMEQWGVKVYAPEAPSVNAPVYVPPIIQEDGCAAQGTAAWRAGGAVVPVHAATRGAEQAFTEGVAFAREQEERAREAREERREREEREERRRREERERRAREEGLGQ